MGKPPVLDLQAVEHSLHSHAQRAFDEGNAVGFLVTAGGGGALALTFDNIDALRQRGIYEACLVAAFAQHRMNNHAWDQKVLTLMFSLADRAKLRAVGDALPGAGPFVLYRGVAGKARRERGMSWTSRLEVACWFARRFDFLESPAVVQCLVVASDVLCFWNQRDESEFIIMPPDRVKQLRLTATQMAEHAAAVQRKAA